MDDADKIDRALVDEIKGLDDGTDPTYFASQINLFSTYCDALLIEIRAAILSGNLSQLENKAHSMNGSCANFGARYAANLLSRLENEAHSMDQVAQQALYEQIAVEYADFCTFLRNAVTAT